MSGWESATAIAALVATGASSARAVAEAALARIAARDGVLNSFTDVVGARTLARADAVDAARAAGRKLGTLAGVPFAVKNLFDIAGLPTRAGSAINRERAPAAQDAVLVARLEAAGAVLVGGLNMGEYAYDFTGENRHDGPSRNPHDAARMSGGSSGGSGAAVAGGMVPLALGSDTNGSIRVPASLCGLFGLKPTYGRLPRTGSFPFVSSLDHLGPLTRGVGDLALAYDAMQGHDPRDPACAARAAEPVSATIDAGIVLGAVTVFIIERELPKAAAFAAGGAALTFFGFIHSEAIGIARSPAVAVAYLAVAGVLMWSAKYAETATVPEGAAQHAD